jgi:hypothetical protein
MNSFDRPVLFVATRLWEAKSACMLI